MLHKMLHNKKGFTLMEGMMVIIIIAVSVAIWGYNGRHNMKIAMMNEAKMFIDKLVAQEKVYYANNGVFINSSTSGSLVVDTTKKTVSNFPELFLSAKSNKYFKTFKVTIPAGKNTVIVDIYPDTSKYPDLDGYYIRGIYVAGIDTIEYNEYYGD